MNILALIPARGGSKGIPRKNLLKLCGIPLIAYPIQTAQQSKYITRIIVSTDDPEIAETARQYGAEVPFLRPAEYATDTALDLGVFQHCLRWLQEHEGKLPDLVVQLRATAPIRDPQEVDRAIEEMVGDPLASSMRSVSPPDFTPYKMWRIDESGILQSLLEVPDVKDWYDQPRQALPKAFAQDGFIDIVRPSTVLEQESMAGTRIRSFLTHEKVIDIDVMQDVEKAERVILSRWGSLGHRLKMRTVDLGIIQGRLTESRSGALQEFPHGCWQAEFDKARQLGFGAIELIVEREHNSDNPIWQGTGLAELKRISQASGVKTHTVCFDTIIANPLHQEVQTIIETMVRTSVLGVKRIVLPCFEASELSASRFDAVVEPLTQLAEIGSQFGMEICLETSLCGSDLQQLLALVNHPAIRVCYDLGNTTYFGHQIAADIRLLGDHIAHVHVKDRTADGENVILGTGGADLAGACEALLEIGYAGSFTFENTRGEDPLKTAERHRAFFLNLLQEAAERLAKSVLQTVK